jgi:hypothetical protein
MTESTSDGGDGGEQPPAAADVATDATTDAAEDAVIPEDEKQNKEESEIPENEGLSKTAEVKVDLNGPTEKGDDDASDEKETTTNITAINPRNSDENYEAVKTSTTTSTPDKSDEAEAAKVTTLDEKEEKLATSNPHEKDENDKVEAEAVTTMEEEKEEKSPTVLPTETPSPPTLDVKETTHETKAENVSDDTITNDKDSGDGDGGIQQDKPQVALSLEKELASEEVMKEQELASEQVPGSSTSGAVAQLLAWSKTLVQMLQLLQQSRKWRNRSRAKRRFRRYRNLK